MWKQLVAPNPNIWCRPGWCLEYVRSSFGLPIVEPSATKGWENAEFKHEDYDFPEGVWVPLWFSIDTIPEGHVVLRAPDGRIYSTSTNANSAYVHPNLEHLIWFYGPRVEPQYQLTLRYLGWSEDISNVRVVENVSEEEDMGTVEKFTPEALEQLASAVMGKEIPWYGFDGKIPASGRTTTNLGLQLGWLDAQQSLILNTVGTVKVSVNAVLDAIKTIPQVDASFVDDLKKQLNDQLKAATEGLKVTLEVAKSESNPS